MQHTCDTCSNNLLATEKTSKDTNRLQSGNLDIARMSVLLLISCLLVYTQAELPEIGNFSNLHICNSTNHENLK